MKAVRDQNDGCRAAKMAMSRTLPDTALREGIFAHPMLAQSRNNLFSKFNLERWRTASARA
jgi:hypothetical protein